MADLSSFPPRKPSEAKFTCSQEQILLIDFSVQTLKKVGFEFAYNSAKSEACYYRLPGKEGVLRIAAHRYGARSEGSTLSFPVWSCLTFPNERIKSVEAFLNMIDVAVGRYVMFPHTKLSNPLGVRDHAIHEIFLSENRESTPNITRQYEPRRSKK